MIKWSLWLLAASLVARGQGNEEYRYKSPIPAGNAYLAEHFDDREVFAEKWISSKAVKEQSEEGTAKYDGEYSVEAPSDENRLKGDLGLVLKSKAKHYALSSELNRPFMFDHRPLIVQYEVQFQNGMECGGAYLKLLTQPQSGSVKDMQLDFNAKTRYSIMFGPDKCGTVQKLHLIFQHKNPKTGVFEEKHWKHAVGAGVAMNGKFPEVFTDKKSHQYTLILDPDNTFEIKIDGRTEVKGHMLEDFEPEVNPPKEIEDVTDQKPEDWDEREKIPDPDARKPDDWDEDEPKEIENPGAVKPSDWLDDEKPLIPDPDAKQPADWDEDMDGTWEAPLIDNPRCVIGKCGIWKAPMVRNPKYKGKWRAPLIDNPAYKGKWKRRTIPNPAYFEDLHPFRLQPVVAVGFELWTMSDGILFDNILVTDDKAVAAQWSEDGFHTKRRMLDKSQSSWFAVFVDYSTQYPWLWAIYVLLLGVPAALFVAYCCSSKPSRYEERGRSKKSDLEEEPQGEKEPLVDVREENDEDVEGEEGEASDAQVVEDEEVEDDAEGEKDEEEQPEAEQISWTSKNTKEEGAGESVKTRKRNKTRKE